jgi:hypothetical protein
MTDASCVRLKEKVLFTSRRIQFRIRRLICHDQQWIDDRVHGQDRMVDLPVEVGVVTNIVASRRTCCNVAARVHLRQPGVSQRRR